MLVLHWISLASTNATLVRQNTHLVYGIQCGNISANPRYLKLYNLNRVPAVGTDVPSMVLLIPGNANGGGNNVIPTYQQGIEFPLGLSFAITGGIADNDATAIGANEVVVNIQLYNK